MSNISYFLKCCMSNPINSSNIQSELNMKQAKEEKIMNKINAYRSSETCDSPKKVNSIHPSFELFQPSIISEVPNISEINSMINKEDSIKDKLITIINKKQNIEINPSEENKNIEIKKLETFGKEKLSPPNSYRIENDQENNANSQRSPTFGISKNDQLIPKPISQVEEKSQMKNPFYLSLEVLRGTHMIKGSKFEINNQGLIGINPSLNDGITYFGSDNTYKINHKRKIDYLSPSILSGFEKVQFFIKYNQNENNYFIQNISQNNGTFFKATSAYKLNTGTIFSIGDFHFAVFIFYDEPILLNDTLSKIVLKCLQEEQLKNTYCFTNKDSPVLIGRKNKCSIKLDNQKLSKVQCRVEYLNNNWYLIDGNESSPSSNGTWIFIENLTEIFDGMIIRAGNSEFKISKCYNIS